MVTPLLCTERAIRFFTFFLFSPAFIHNAVQATTHCMCMLVVVRVVTMVVLISHDSASLLFRFVDLKLKLKLKVEALSPGLLGRGPLLKAKHNFAASYCGGTM